MTAPDSGSGFPWFDAHLDLACLAVNGRDLTAPLDRCGGPWPPAAVSLPSLREGRVVACLATIFTEADGSGPEGYPSSDAERAHAVGRAQLEVYLTLRDRGLLAIDLPRALRLDPAVGSIRGGMGVAEVVPPSPRQQLDALARDHRLHVGILIEGADPIRDPEDLKWWKDHGVCAVGMAWWKSSRYAGGNGSTTGLTDLGRALAGAADQLRIVHDVSHLSDRAADDLFECSDQQVIASHSNARALLSPLADGSPNQRHLHDRHIREIVRRGGVIGLNLFDKFIRDGGGASIDDAVRHVEHICDIAGSRANVGLGSDMDGGLSAEQLPTGIRKPADLHALLAALAARGWTREDLESFACGNWVRFWRAHAAKTHPARAV